MKIVVLIVALFPCPFVHGNSKASLKTKEGLTPDKIPISSLTTSKNQAESVQLKEERELELLAQTVIEEALKKVESLKDEAEKKEMLQLVTKFRDIIFVLIENHFEEDTLKKDEMEDIKKLDESTKSIETDKEAIDDKNYDRLIDNVIDEVVEIEKEKQRRISEGERTKLFHKLGSNDENAFAASRGGSKRTKIEDTQEVVHQNSNQGNKLVSELKGEKQVDKKYNVPEGPTMDENPRQWVKYLIYNKPETHTKEIVGEKEPVEKKKSKDAPIGSAEEELLGLKVSPEKGMLESTLIKGGQVDFTTGKEPNHGAKPQEQATKQETSKEDDKKSTSSKNDVYDLINQMIGFLKHAENKENLEGE